MTTPLVLLIIAVLLLSAFFSGMEIAFVSSSKLRYEVDKTDRSLVSRLLGAFYRHPDDYISSMLVGNNVVLVIYSILMSRLLDPWLEQVLPHITDTLLLLIDTLISTAIVLVFGEFLPKTLFKINANATLRLLSLPAGLFYVVLWPFARFASLCSRGLLRIVGIRTGNAAAQHTFTKTDLDDLIESSLQAGGGDAATEVQIFQNALDFGDIRVRDCMVPRGDIAAVNKDCTTEELVHMFVDTGYSKIVVYDTTIDHIIGYIHSSELFKQAGETCISDCSLRKMPIVPETAKAQKLMRTLMQQHLSLAVVVDEFGGTAGIVSLEDIVEELTGDIEDEHDTQHLVARRTKDGDYILSARMEIEKVNELFDLDLPLDDEYHTIGGLILHHYHSIPAVGQDITLPEGFRFKILRADKNKINLVRLEEK